MLIDVDVMSRLATASRGSRTVKRCFPERFTPRRVEQIREEALSKAQATERKVRREQEGYQKRLRDLNKSSENVKLQMVKAKVIGGPSAKVTGIRESEQHRKAADRTW